MGVARDRACRHPAGSVRAHALRGRRRAGRSPISVAHARSRWRARSPPACASCMHPKLVIGADAMLVVSPEHARVFREAGWTRRGCARSSTSCSRCRARELVRGAGGIAEGIPERLAGATLPKFRPGGLLIVHAGGTAGLFSADHRRLGVRRHRQRAGDEGDSTMNDTGRTYLDPTGGAKPRDAPRAARPAALAGAVVGLVDIGKPRGDVFLDRLAEHLEARGLARRAASPNPRSRSRRRSTCASASPAECQVVDPGAGRLRIVRVVQCARRARLRVPWRAGGVRRQRRVRAGGAAQAHALGGDPARVFVPHPIQDRTDDEMRAMADAAVDAVLAALQA